ncbi:MAG: fatty acid desaturase, partial [Deltaproteobacteria bacterium]|nr:fatty acid desaturase [Deltaproteobacteria bacterium]
AVAVGGGAAREPIRQRELPRELLARSAWRGLPPLLRTWGLIALVAAVAGAWSSPLGWLAAFLLIGVLQHSLIVLAHHSQHFDLAASRRLNDAAGTWLLHAPLLNSLRQQRHIHFQHHARLGEEDDPDRYYYDLALHDRADGRGLRRWAAGMFAGAVVLPNLRKLLRGRYARDLGGKRAATLQGGDVIAIAVCQLALIAGLWALTGSIFAYPFLWIAPMLTVAAGLNGVRSMLEHADRGAPPARMLTFAPPRLERAVLGPVNMNFHWEHHRFIAVPYYHLPAVRVLLQARQDLAPARLLPGYRHRFAALCDG